MELSLYQKLPSHAVNIRAIETIRYEVRDQQKNQVLEEIEESKAFFQVYEGAVYMCQGKTYLVEKLDLSNKVAFCKEADLKYYTKTRDYTDIHVIGGNIVRNSYLFINCSDSFIVLLFFCYLFYTSAVIVAPCALDLCPDIKKC